MANPINQKVFAGAPIRAKESHRKIGTKGEKTKPKKGDTRNDGSERYTGTKWVKVNKVKEAKKKAAEGIKAAKDKKGSAYVGR